MFGGCLHETLPARKINVGKHGIKQLLRRAGQGGRANIEAKNLNDLKACGYIFCSSRLDNGNNC